MKERASGAAKYQGTETMHLKDQVRIILDAIETSVGTIRRIKLDGCKKKMFFIVSVQFENLITEIQIRLPARTSQNRPPDDHIKWEVERTFGECVSSSAMGLDAACLAFFSGPCGFNFEKFDGTQRVTLRCVNGAIDVQQTILQKAKEAPKQETFASQWSKELERCVCMCVCVCLCMCMYVHYCWCVGVLCCVCVVLCVCCVVCVCVSG